jgi:hypothetical protein
VPKLQNGLSNHRKIGVYRFEAPEQLAAGGAGTSIGRTRRDFVTAGAPFSP